ncbi:MAG: hypothetical protein FWE38_05425 [Firmicutes bacterium]|nr:hypothetical protein [Bacillota bacterium]
MTQTGGYPNSNAAGKNRTINRDTERAFKHARQNPDNYDFVAMDDENIQHATQQRAVETADLVREYGNVRGLPNPSKETVDYEAFFATKPAEEKVEWTDADLAALEDTHDPNKPIDVGYGAPPPPKPEVGTEYGELPTRETIHTNAHRVFVRDNAPLDIVRKEKQQAQTIERNAARDAKTHMSNAENFDYTAMDDANRQRHEDQSWIDYHAEKQAADDNAYRLWDAEQRRARGRVAKTEGKNTTPPAPSAEPETLVGRRNPRTEPIGQQPQYTPNDPHYPLDYTRRAEQKNRTINRDAERAFKRTQQNPGDEIYERMDDENRGGKGDQSWIDYHAEKQAADDNAYRLWDAEQRRARGQVATATTPDTSTSNDGPATDFYNNESINMAVQSPHISPDMLRQLGEHAETGGDTKKAEFFNRAYADRTPKPLDAAKLNKWASVLQNSTIDGITKLATDAQNRGDAERAQYLFKIAADRQNAEQGQSKSP